MEIKRIGAAPPIANSSARLASFPNKLMDGKWLKLSTMIIRIRKNSVNARTNQKLGQSNESDRRQQHKYGHWPMLQLQLLPTAYWSQNSNQSNTLHWTKATQYWIRSYNNWLPFLFSKKCSIIFVLSDFFLFSSAFALRIQRVFIKKICFYCCTSSQKTDVNKWH